MNLTMRLFPWLFCLLSLLALTGCHSSSSSTDTAQGDSHGTTDVQQGNDTDNYPAKNAYLITNRNNPVQVADSFPNSKSKVIPQSDGGLSFYLDSTGIDAPDNNFNSTAESVFLDSLGNDLERLAQNKTAQITIFIHGLTTSWEDAQTNVKVYGQNMWQEGYNNGVVVGFSWPSYATDPAIQAPHDLTFIDILDTALMDIGQLGYYANSYIQTDSSGNLRANINGSVVSFKNMLNSLLGMKTRSYSFDSLRVNLVAHSEGGYMAMLGMNYVNSVDGLNGEKLDQVLLLAPDIDAGALQSPGSDQTASGTTGDGQGIADLARFVTVYYSDYDTDLMGTSALTWLHNPLHPMRFGLVGSIADGTLQSNVAMVSCRQINNWDRLEGLIGTSYLLEDTVSTHMSYIYCTEILNDESQVLLRNDISGKGIYGRQEGDWAWVDILPMNNLFCITPDTLETVKVSCGTLE